MNHPRTIRSTLALGLVGILSLSACGGSGAPEAAAPAEVDYDCANPTEADSPIPVTFAANAIVSNGAVYAGLKEGFFEDHGIELEIQPVANVAAAISSVQGGTTDFGFATSVSIFQAIDSGIPVSIVAPFAGIAPDYYDKMKAGEEGYTTEVTALVAAPDSGIETPGDLEGKTVAVADAKGQSELTTRYVIREAGADPDAVEYTVMSFPDSLNAFKAGQVDAIFSVDPFLKQATEAGGEIISWPGVETFHEGPTSAIISSNDFIESNPDTVARFTCAIQASNNFSNENQDAVRAATAEAQDVDPATLAEATVPYFYATADVEGLKRFSSIMHEFGFINEEIDIESVVLPRARANA